MTFRTLTTRARSIAAGSLLLAAMLTSDVIATYAQLPSTPGLPWTYLPDAEFSPEDSAWIESISRELAPAEVRYAYKIHYHIDLVDTTGGVVNAELPRNPGESDIYGWNLTKFGLDSTTIPRGRERRYLYSYRVNGFRSEGKNDGASFSTYYRPRQVVWDVEYPVAFWASISHSPTLYQVYKPRHTADSIGFFVQFVDSIHHPAISPVAETYLTFETPPYPNPFTTDLRFDAPDAWRGEEGEVLVFGGGGRVLYRESLNFAHGTQRITGAALAALPSGRYTLILRNPARKPSLAVTQVVKR